MIHTQNAEWGYKENVGFNRMIYGDNETFCKRTANAIQKIIDSERKQLYIYKKLAVLSEEEIVMLEQALNMVQSTLNNTTI